MYVGSIDVAAATAAGNTVVPLRDGRVKLVDGRTGEVLATVPADNVFEDQAGERRAAVSGGLEDVVVDDGPDTRELELSGGEVLGVELAGRVSGRCGVSWYYMYNSVQSDRGYIRTGFDLYWNAYDFRWRTLATRETSGSEDVNYYGDDGPMWPDDVWQSGSQYFTALFNGTYYGRVYSGTAYLTDGRVCYTGYPTDSAYIS